MIDLDAEGQALLGALGEAQPTYATRPTPGAVHDLKAVRLAAGLTGTPLMPWQTLVARVATERLPPRATGEPAPYRYPVIVLTVPRQAGKTTLMRSVLTSRAIMNRNRVAFYTAQTGKDASARWKDLVSAIEDGPLAPHVHKLMGAGAQSLTFPTGSTIAPFAPTPKSLHGYTPHDVFCDEVFAHDAQQGSDLMGAIKPAQVTLPDRQLWLVSTKGNAYSGFLNEWIDKGRAAIDDPDSGIAFFEWSADPSMDLYDPRAWGFHPALGHTITREDLAEAANVVPRGEWERAYMNLQTSTAETFVPLPVWDALADDPEAAPPWSEVAVGVEVAADGSRSAVVGAWQDAEGWVQVKVIRSAPSHQWLWDWTREHIVGHRPRAFGADKAGQTRVFTDAARTALDLDISELTAGDFATACAAFKTRILDGTIRHDGSPALRSSIEAAATRPLGESWAFSRTRSAGPIPELIAAVVAVRLLEQAEAPSKPSIRF